MRAERTVFDQRPVGRIFRHKPFLKGLDDSGISCPVYLDAFKLELLPFDLITMAPVLRPVSARRL